MNNLGDPSANPKRATRPSELPLQYRRAKIERDSVERAAEEEAPRFDLTFSSEAPYQRYWGTEILDHNPASVRLDRLRAGGPVLVDHQNRVDAQIGVVEKASIKDRKGRATVRLAKGLAKVDEVVAKIEQGILRNVSVAYIVHEAKETKKRDGQVSEFLITDWEPVEVSLVSVPSDPTVGLERSDDHRTYPVNFLNTRGLAMSEKNDNERDQPDRGQEVVVEVGAEMKRSEEHRKLRNNATKFERERVINLLKIGSEFGAREEARKLVASGGSIDDLRRVLLEKTRQNIATEPFGADLLRDNGELGMSSKEIGRFRFVRLIRHLAEPSSARFRTEAAFEIEVTSTASEQISKRGIREPRSEHTVPSDVLSAPLIEAAGQRVARRDLVIGTDTAGGHLRETELWEQSFIDILRNAAVVLPVATTLRDLTGNVSIPRQTGAGAIAWLSDEQGAATETTPTFDQVQLSPKEAGAYTNYSRKLLLQSSIDVEAFVRTDLAMGMARDIDAALISGSGSSGQPKGILNTAGIGSADAGTNSGPPTWALVVKLETEVAQDNADIGALYYLLNAKLRGKLKTLAKESGTADFVWDGRAAATPLNGYPALITNAVPGNLTKGTHTDTDLSACIFGNFRDLLVGFWSGADILVNPYTGDTTRTTRVSIYQDVDCAVRHAESFAAAKDWQS